MLVFTLVGLPYEADTIETVIREFLERLGVTVQIIRQSELTTGELLAEPNGSDVPSTRIWIPKQGPDRVVLYFGEPDRGRHLLPRALPLRNVLNELDREQVAQVVRHAALALLEGDDSDGGAVVTKERFEKELAPSQLPTPRAPESEPACAAG